MPATEYVLQPRPPVRAFLISALTCAIATAMIAVSRTLAWPLFVTIAFAVVLLAGIALAGAGFASMKKMRVYVHLDDEGYRITGLGAERAGAWREVTKVTETTDGRHITIYHGDVARTHLLCPSGTASEQFQALLADISRRLNQAYGYGFLGL